MQWWSSLDVYSKKNLLLFASLGLDGFKYFIIDNDENFINKLLYNFKKCKIKDQKISLCSLKFSIDFLEKLELLKKKLILLKTFSIYWQNLLSKKVERNEYTGSRTSSSRYNTFDLFQLFFS